MDVTGKSVPRHASRRGVPMFKRILIANRGEIAVRIIRACREMGIESVAVFSDVDRRALHVRKSDHAYHIGPATASESYLNIDKILDVAKRSGAEAIHPGYGFLSENAGFARACRDAGVKFIGPTPESMEMMGSKTRARQNMKKAGVPFVPGSEKGMEYEATETMAAEIGYPVMLKAAAGGGGKGMRLVHKPEDLRSAFENARSESKRAFGDDEVYIEKAIVNPRHIEMQIFGDEHGNVVYLGERECSVQRRHQKVLEESPSPIVDDRHAPPHGRGRRARRQGRQLPERRHGRVPGRSAEELLLPRDEHPPAGGASGHRVRHRPRPRASATARRGGRAAALPAGRHHAARPCHRVPRLCRGPRQQFLPLAGPDHPPDFAFGAGHPPRQRHV